MLVSSTELVLFTKTLHLDTRFTRMLPWSSILTLIPCKQNCLYYYYGSTGFCSFLILYTVGRTPWAGDQPVARPLPTPQQYKQTYMPWVGFELTIPAFERAKAVHSLDREATVIGWSAVRLIGPQTCISASHSNYPCLNIINYLPTYTLHLLTTLINSISDTMFVYSSTYQHFIT
jgi:hypothetical protein